jgi:arylsulfatase A-like enzyme
MRCTVRLAASLIRVWCVLGAMLHCPAFAADAASKPNILWITSEDHGPHMGCYGDPNARTPNVDALAARGMLFTRAWSGVPVCAPARSTIITGM